VILASHQTLVGVLPLAAKLADLSNDLDDSDLGAFWGDIRKRVNAAQPEVHALLLAEAKNVHDLEVDEPEVRRRLRFRRRPRALDKRID
jgi:hypothetical protein